MKKHALPKQQVKNLNLVTKTIFSLFLLSYWLLQANHCQAQEFSVGTFFGISNYAGELSPSYWQMNEMHPALGINATWGINNLLSLRGVVQYGTISGNDKNAQVPENQLRNLHFKSPIGEGSLQALFHFLGKKHLVSPYLYAGISSLHFSPKAKYEAQWVALQPLGTEGQGLSNEKPRLYKLWATALALGGGITVALNRTWQTDIELGYRRTNTDYLDDISTTYYDNDLLRLKRGDMAANLADRSTEIEPDKPPFNAFAERGNPKTKDTYFWIGFTINYLLKNTSNSKSERYSCPTF